MYCCDGDEEVEVSVKTQICGGRRLCENGGRELLPFQFSMASPESLRLLRELQAKPENKASKR